MLLVNMALNGLSLKVKIFAITASVLIGGLLLCQTSAEAATISISGNVTSTTWTSNNVYVVLGSSFVTPTSTLTINPGTVIKLGGGADFEVGGTLNAVGASTSTIYFTSYDDDSVGGDTNGDGTSTTPHPGDGGHIQIDAGASATISFANVRYGDQYYSGSPTADIYQIGGNLTLSNVTIASSSAYGVNIGGGIITISTSTIMNNASFGLYENNSTGTLTLRGTSFSTNGKISNNTADAFINLSNGMSFNPSGNSDIATTTGTGYRGIILNAFAATSTTIVSAGATLPYINPGSVGSGTILTISSGTVIKFGQGNSFDVNANGTLNVQGVSTNQVYFTSLTDDSIGGDTNADGTSTTPQPGDGGDIDIYAGASSTITYATIRYGDHYVYGSETTNIYQNGGNLTLSYATIASSSAYGVNIGGGNTIISSSTISNNSSFGIYESGSSGTLTLANTSFSTNGSTTNNTGDAFINLSSGVNFVPSGNADIATTTGTGYRGFVMSGTLATSTTWNWGGLPYVITGSVTVASGTTLTVGPDIFVKTSAGADLEVADNGTLNAPLVGADQASFFTSLTDDSLGGDTNANSTSTTPKPGDAGYIKIDTGGNTTLDYMDAFYGGASPGYSDIDQAGGNLTLYSVTLASSSNYGLYSTGGTSTVQYSNFVDNPYGIWMNAGSVNVETSSTFQGPTSTTAYGMYNNSGVTSTATAEGDYWNSFLGPYNANSNPSGTVSEQTSNYINFSPWVSSDTALYHYFTLCQQTPTSSFVFCSSVKSSSTLFYYASTSDLTALNAAVTTWNTLASSTSGGIRLASTTLASSTGYLKISDVNLSDTGVVGLWTHDSNPSIPSSTIWFNQYWASTFAPANLQNLATHELGHGLGLADEDIPGDIEFFYNTPQTTLGSQDINDYDYLW